MFSFFYIVQNSEGFFWNTIYLSNNTIIPVKRKQYYHQDNISLFLNKWKVHPHHHMICKMQLGSFDNISCISAEIQDVFVRFFFNVAFDIYVSMRLIYIFERFGSRPCSSMWSRDHLHNCVFHHIYLQLCWLISIRAWAMGLVLIGLAKSKGGY